MSPDMTTGQQPVVIAHRGASGYLPEHTLAAKALAFGMRSDYLEQDVVLTRDDQPIVLHDIHLDTVTDVARRFPERARQDGRYYAIDFTLAEIRTLRVHERARSGSGSAVYPQRFPLDAARDAFSIPTLAEEIEMIQGLNRSAKRSVGIYPELKAPAWHRQQGKDISRIVLQLLRDYGYESPDDRIYLQCFDPDELRRIRNEFQSRLPLIQLIGENNWDGGRFDYDQMRTDAGLTQVTSYAQGIGPRIEHVLDAEGGVTDLPLLAKKHGLLLHPFTFRCDELPEFAATPEELLDGLFRRAGVDGLFTDFPDVVVTYLGE